MQTTHSDTEATPEAHDIIVVGGGLQGALVALAVLSRHPDLRVAVIEAGDTFGGNHTWCMHSEDAPAGSAALLEPLLVHRWEGYDVAFPGHARTLGGEYACVTSQRLHRVLVGALRGARRGTALLSTKAESLQADGVRLSDGRFLSAPVVIDARGPARESRDCGYQKFLGLELQLTRPHGLRRPILMDAGVPQLDGFRFMYVLPLGPRRLLVEDTSFSRSPELDDTSAARAVRAYTELRFGPIANVQRSERGILPMPHANAFGPPRVGEAPIAAGYRGGFFHPGTGYSMPAALAFAQCVAAHPTRDALGPALSQLWEAHRTQARYGERLNWLLFHCFEAPDMHNVFSRFYRLPEPLIHRFYGMRTTALDRARVLVGWPPRGVSLSATLRHLREDDPRTADPQTAAAPNPDENPHRRTA